MCLTEESKRRYRQYLEDLANDKSPSDEIFSNGGKDHAIVLYQILLKHTKNEVRIFCEGGISEVWRDEGMHRSLIDYIEKENSDGQRPSLHILVEHDNPEAFEGIRGRENVHIRLVSEEGRSRIHRHFDNDNCNFAVFDEEKYRYEYDKQTFKAYGSFNRPVIARTMIDLFDEVWALSVQ